MNLWKFSWKSFENIQKFNIDLEKKKKEGIFLEIDGNFEWEFRYIFS